MNLTYKMTDSKNRFHSRLKFPGEINLTVKMNLTDDCEASLKLTLHNEYLFTDRIQPFNIA